MGAAKLIINDADGERIVTLEGETWTLGQEADITITGDDIAPVHAELSFDGESFHLNPINGSELEVEGEVVDEEVEVGDFDAITFGGARLVIDMEALGDDTVTVRLPKSRGRRRRVVRRRSGTRKTVGRRKKRGPVFTEEDLRVVLDTLLDEQGMDGLERLSVLLDEYYKDELGSGRVESLVHHRDNLLRLMEINTALNSEHVLGNLLELIMDGAIEVSGAERGFLILEEEGNMAVRVARNFDREAVQQPSFKFSRTIAEQVIEDGTPVITADAQNDEDLPASISVTDLKLRSLCCVPFKHKGRITGCLYVDNRFQTGVFTQDDLQLLESFADQAAIAIENARLMEENRRRQEALIESKNQVEKLNELLEEKVEKQEAELHEVRASLQRSRTTKGGDGPYGNIIGVSKSMREVFRLLDRICPTDVPALIQGESGTGKELVARAIHTNGPRADKPFISENVAAISETLLESELFGHVKGAFTGATGAHKGLFELADGGTLFLDEIAEMSLEMQKKLLRVLQENEIRPVGSEKTKKVNVRVICASNKDLKQWVDEKKFREDLFYRINVFTIQLPPLRDRRDDIPLMADHFLRNASPDTEPPVLDREAVLALTNYDWPGNVRELENEMLRLIAMRCNPVMLQDLKPEAQQGATILADDDEDLDLKQRVKEAQEEVEARVIRIALAKARGVKSEAARLLEVSRPTLDAKLEQYGISVEPYQK